MALIPYREREPWKVLTTLQDEMDKIFSSWFGKVPSLRREAFTPSVDVSEDKDNIYVEADLPGMQRKDINIKMSGNSLVISAKKEEAKEEKKKNYYCCERYQGNFYRLMDLPSSVNVSKISAMYKDGVLKVALPKKEEEKEKEVKIDVE